MRKKSGKQVTRIIAAGFAFMSVFAWTCFAQAPSAPATPAPGEFTVDANTVALWNFDEGEGSILRDLGPIGINLQYAERGDKKPNETPPEWVRGKFGKALLFNADFRQQYGNTDDAWKKFFGLDKEFTFEAWIRPENLAIPAPLSIFQNMRYQKTGFRITLTADFKVGFMLEDGTNEIFICGIAPLITGAWSHIACTYDGKTAKIYVNGALDAQKEVPNAVIQSESDGYSIGYTGGMPHFHGAIDSIRISNAARAEFTIK
jgi:hypothetical protein